MEQLNRIEIRGVIGSLKLQTFSETVMARITVATNYAYKDKTGKAVIETNWHSIVAREGKYVKDLEKLKKGDKVYVQGRLRYQKISGPAELLAKFTPDSMGLTFWVLVVFGYYLIATILPIDKVDEENLGALLFFFEFACGVSAYTLGINPFNQPGVEAYKKNMFALLRKPGYEAQTEEILKRL